MRAISLLGALCFAALGCGRTEIDDLKALQGSWQVVSALDRGKPVPAEKMDAVEFEFQGEALVIRENGKEQERVSFTLDVTQSPRVLRLTAPGKEKRVFEAIYEVRGDTLKFAGSKNDQPRPTSFDADPPGDIQLFVFKRKK